MSKQNEFIPHQTAANLRKAILETSSYFENFHGSGLPTPLILDRHLSELYGANIYLKREDLSPDKSPVGSYKWRGALNFVRSLTPEERGKGVICASAGNHAQGIASACNHLGVKGYIVMPITTPLQKVDAVRSLCNGTVEVILDGDDFDVSAAIASNLSQRDGLVYAHPFNDLRVIAGQGTLTREIVEKLEKKLDILISPIGGGGLISGAATYLPEKVKLYGVEHEGALTMKTALREGRPTLLDKVDRFVDGTAVKLAGELTFNLLKEVGMVSEDVVSLTKGEICTTAVKLHNRRIHAELAGAMSVAALDKLRGQIEGKNIVCIVSGGNIGADRWVEIFDESLIHELKRRYVILYIPDRPKAFEELLGILHGRANLAKFSHKGIKDSEGRAITTGILDFENPKDFELLRTSLPPAFDLEDVTNDSHRRLYF